MGLQGPSAAMVLAFGVYLSRANAACSSSKRAYTARMRPLALSLLACCFLAARAAAQVSVEIVLDQQQFLKDESVPLKVRITNRSGQTVHFGKSKDWLTFSAESRDGY